MNEIIELIEWTIYQPLQAMFVLMFAYALLFTLYHQTRLRQLAKACGPIFLVYDVLVNVFAMSILMLDTPRPPWTVTARLKRYKIKYGAWPEDNNIIERYRYWVAVNLCKLANKFDEDHC